MKDKLMQILINRLVIAIAAAVGGFVVSEWPTVHFAMCEEVQYYEEAE